MIALIHSSLFVSVTFGLVIGSSHITLLDMAAHCLVSRAAFRALSARTATPITVHLRAPAVSYVRAFSSTITKDQARPTLQGDGKGDRVNPESPFSESAGVNPVDHYKAIAGPLHDFGSYITSCMFYANVRLP